MALQDEPRAEKQVLDALGPATRALRWPMSGDVHYSRRRRSRTGDAPRMLAPTAAILVRDGGTRTGVAAYAAAVALLRSAER